MASSGEEERRLLARQPASWRIVQSSWVDMRILWSPLGPGSAGAAAAPSSGVLRRALWRSTSTGDSASFAPFGYLFKVNLSIDQYTLVNIFSFLVTFMTSCILAVSSGTESESPVCNLGCAVRGDLRIRIDHALRQLLGDGRLRYFSSYCGAHIEPVSSRRFRAGSWPRLVSVSFPTERVKRVSFFFCREARHWYVSRAVDWKGSIRFSHTLQLRSNYAFESSFWMFLTSKLGSSNVVMTINRISGARSN